MKIICLSLSFKMLLFAALFCGISSCNDDDEDNPSNSEVILPNSENEENIDDLEYGVFNAQNGDLYVTPCLKTVNGNDTVLNHLEVLFMNQDGTGFRARMFKTNSGHKWIKTSTYSHSSKERNSDDPNKHILPLIVEDYEWPNGEKIYVESESIMISYDVDDPYAIQNVFVITNKKLLKNGVEQDSSELKETHYEHKFLMLIDSSKAIIGKWFDETNNQYYNFTQDGQCDVYSQNNEKWTKASRKFIVYGDFLVLIWKDNVNGKTQDNVECSSISFPNKNLKFGHLNEEGDKEAVSTLTLPSVN